MARSRNGLTLPFYTQSSALFTTDIGKHINQVFDRHALSPCPALTNHDDMSGYLQDEYPSLSRCFGEAHAHPGTGRSRRMEGAS